MQQEPSERTTLMPGIFVAGHEVEADMIPMSTGWEVWFSISGDDQYPPTDPVKVTTVIVVDDFLYRLIGD
jgi:hypothetical protein